MNPWEQQQPGPNWGPPPQQPYPQGPYPPQPYAQQPYPQQGYPPPGYPPQYPGHPYPPQRPPSSGSAVTAIVLSFLVALFQVLASIGAFAISSELIDAGNAAEDWVPGFLIFDGIARLIAGGALAAGAILLLLRKTLGRWTVAGAAIVIIGLQVLEYVARAAADLSTSGASPLSTLISVILPIVLIVLALNGATRRWLEQRRPGR